MTCPTIAGLVHLEGDDAADAEYDNGTAFLTGITMGVEALVTGNEMDEPVLTSAGLHLSEVCAGTGGGPAVGVDEVEAEAEPAECTAPFYSA